MNTKDKFILILLTIITLGLIWIFINKKREVPENNLKVGSKIPFKMGDLLFILGKDNIISSSSTHTKVKVQIKSSENVDFDALSKLKGVSGTFSTSNSITIIIGNSAPLVDQQINKVIGNERGK